MVAGNARHERDRLWARPRRRLHPGTRDAVGQHGAGRADNAARQPRPARDVRARLPRRGLRNRRRVPPDSSVYVPEPRDLRTLAAGAYRPLAVQPRRASGITLPSLRGHAQRQRDDRLARLAGLHRERRHSYEPDAAGVSAWQGLVFGIRVLRGGLHERALAEGAALRHLVAANTDGEPWRYRRPARDGPHGAAGPQLPRRPYGRGNSLSGRSRRVPGAECADRYYSSSRWSASAVYAGRLRRSAREHEQRRTCRELRDGQRVHAHGIAHVYAQCK